MSNAKFSIQAALVSANENRPVVMQCGRQFIESPTRQPINHSTRKLIDKLLLEHVSLAAIARITGVSARYLQYYVNQKKYYQIFFVFFTQLHKLSLLAPINYKSLKVNLGR
jgi:AraC-like DNA-binding protein